MTGIEFLTRMRDFGENAPPIGTFVDFRLEEIDRGRITVSGIPSGDHYNPFGVVHGGFASTLIDLALGHVSISILDSMDFMVSTTDLNVKYVRPMFASTGAGVTPDIVTLSKALTAGTLPLAATLARAQVFDAFG